MKKEFNVKRLLTAVSSGLEYLECWVSGLLGLSFIACLLYLCGEGDSMILMIPFFAPGLLVAVLAAGLLDYCLQREEVTELVSRLVNYYRERRKTPGFSRGECQMKGEETSMSPFDYEVNQFWESDQEIPSQSNESREIEQAKILPTEILIRKLPLPNTRRSQDKFASHETI